MGKSKPLPTSVTEIQEDYTDRQPPGWLFPYMLGMDHLPGVGTGRWHYWLDIVENLRLPEDPIPQIAFAQLPETHMPFESMVETSEAHIKRILSPYVQKGLGWYDDAWLALVAWLLHGFGDVSESVERDYKRIPPDLASFWYNQFNLAYMLSSPMDWAAWILQGGPSWMGNGSAKWAKSTGFFSTPMDICKLMAMMTMGTTEEDTRPLSTLDPCVGTGSMLLAASNYSLRLYGTDIVMDLVNCCKLNGWLWAPWMIFNTVGTDAMWKTLDDERHPTTEEVEDLATIAASQRDPETGQLTLEILPELVILETRPERVENIKAHRESKFTQPLLV